MDGLIEQRKYNMNYYEKTPSYNKLWLVTTQEAFNSIVSNIPPNNDQLNTAIEELNANLPMKALRTLRNEALQMFDWRISRATSGGVALSPQWVLFLQSLRDLPQTQTPVIDPQQLTLTNVAWPTKPDVD
jgi:hypothetical protein